MLYGLLLSPLFLANALIVEPTGFYLRLLVLTQNKRSQGFVNKAAVASVKTAISQGQRIDFYEGATGRLTKHTNSLWYQFWRKVKALKHWQNISRYLSDISGLGVFWLKGDLW